jgi:hypothetical protein
MQHCPVVSDDRRQPGHVHLVLPDQLAAEITVWGVEPNGHSVDGERVTQIMSTGIPLFTNHPVHQVPWSVCNRPGAERLLHLRIERLLRTDPSLHHPAIDPAQCASTLQRGQLPKRNPGVELIQIKQQDPRDTAVQISGALQELDPVAVWQVQVRGYQRHLLAVSSQHLKLGDTVRRRACGQYSIVRSEPTVQR